MLLKKIAISLVSIFLLLGCNETPTPTLPVENLVSSTISAESTSTPAPTDTIAIATPAPTKTATAEPTKTPPATLTPVAMAEPTGTPEPIGQFIKTDCPFDTADLYRELYCGMITVAANRYDPNNLGRLKLAVVIFPSENPDPLDPVLFIDGGPGSHTLSLLPLIFESWYGHWLADHDLILFDQRGVGYSQPALDCPEWDGVEQALFTQKSDFEEVAKQSQQALGDCHTRMLAEGIDLSAYNTTTSSADVETIREALGYKKWHIVGSSYGTLVAQKVMAAYPDTIISAVLDSPVPFSADIISQAPLFAEQTLQTIFGRCATQYECSRYFQSDLVTELTELVEKLNQKPRTVEVVNPLTGEIVEVVVDGNRLVSVLINGSYSADLMPVLPKVIADVRDGNDHSLAQLLVPTLISNDHFSVGQFFSVQCQEALKQSDPAAVKKAIDEAIWAKEGNPYGGLLAFELCKIWGDGGFSAEQTISPTVPTLILSGALDPITPPSFAKRVAQTLPASKLLSFPATSHTVLFNRCARTITHQYLKDASRPLNLTCRDEESFPTFYMGTGSVQLAFVEKRIEPLQIETLAPKGWNEPGAGLFIGEDNPLANVVLIHKTETGGSAESFFDSFSTSLTPAQLSFESLEERYDSPHLQWTLYQATQAGMKYDVAIAVDDKRAYGLALIVDSAERDFYYKTVFQTALSAIQPLTPP